MRVVSQLLSLVVARQSWLHPSILSCLVIQVGGKMSSLRLVQQGRPYQLPPQATGTPPQLDESITSWRDNVTSAAALAAVVADAKAKPVSSHGRSSLANTTDSNTSIDEGISQHHNTRSSSGGSSSSSTAGSSLQPSMPHSSRKHPIARAPSVVEGLVRAYRGVSPALAEQLCAAAGVVPQATAASLSDADWQALHNQWHHWLHCIQAGEGFTPTLDIQTGRCVWLVVSVAVA